MVDKLDVNRLESGFKLQSVYAGSLFKDNLPWDTYGQYWTFTPAQMDSSPNACPDSA